MAKEKDLILFAKTLHLFSALWLQSLLCGSKFPGNSQHLLKNNEKMRRTDNWSFVLLGLGFFWLAGFWFGLDF